MSFLLLNIAREGKANLLFVTVICLRFLCFFFFFLFFFLKLNLDSEPWLNGKGCCLVTWKSWVQILKTTSSLAKIRLRTFTFYKPNVVIVSCIGMIKLEVSLIFFNKKIVSLSS